MSNALKAQWGLARELTPARLQLGRAGVSLPTSAHLSLLAAHALARDAVARPMDRDALHRELEPLGLPIHWLQSKAADLGQHLSRPDWGRRLSADSHAGLAERSDSNGQEHDLVFVLGDGLSSAAIERFASPLLRAILPPLLSQNWRVGPLSVVCHARVAVGDEIAELLKSKLVVVLIGERPGLSSPVSMGAYWTWSPRVGTLDAQRNCLSNIRGDGLTPDAAASELLNALIVAKRIGATGVALQQAQPVAITNVA